MSQWDIYWVNFAFSIDPSACSISTTECQIKEVYYSTQLDDRDIALELLPERYSIPVKVKETSKTPEIGVEAHGMSLHVKEFYEQTVEYEQLRPTIIANGLQEHKFGWILKDDAAGEGANRFVGVIGVPKGTRALYGQSVVPIKLANGGVGGWFQSQVISTGTNIFDIPLR
jgi:hypothetical protein